MTKVARVGLTGGGARMFLSAASSGRLRGSALPPLRPPVRAHAIRET